ncbi:peptidoglycan bridge formation protein FemAB [Bifidobacterium eulemuris]|uniref:Aminoacyltransferase n=2 Tax=Bifidobacterium eulemuris TaxID=1765219 RepID=A0A261G531_9BIFI|nr:aminoacyltransferase [Bifidobacterium eulemuris]OZG66522.1 peptidoglycan bridge formation protein FemAB [Bifidobacterium eulemuris]QOL32613.1 aminoacyltransferase [Bifidobacterium eulemuris]
MSSNYSSGTITLEELDELSAGHPQGGFQQSSGQVRLLDRRGAGHDLVGVRRDGRLVAACVIAYTRGRLGAEGSIWFGPIGDITDDGVLAAMTDAIRDSARKHGAVCVSCWPNTVYRRRLSDGTPCGAADDGLIRKFRSQGWTHGGFTQGYGIVCRWMYAKDLAGFSDEGALLESYDKRMQWSVKRSRSMGVRVRELDMDELHVFARIEQQTAERRNFSTRDERYFRDFKQAFGDKAHFMVAEIHVDEYLADMTAKRDALQAKVAALQAKYDQRPTTKISRQLGEETRNLTAAQKRLDEAVELVGQGDVLPAAASLIVEHPQEMVYLYSGSVERYKPFYASALIQHWAMSRCLELGIARYNFYGISGVFDDPDDEGRGVLEFKQGFNGYVWEMPGEFTLPIRRLRYGFGRMLRRLLRR